MDDWTADELAGAVEAYREMQRLETLRRPYNKREIYRELGARYGRTDKAFEYRMQNISAVLAEIGQPWLPGLKPAGNVGANVKPRIAELLGRPMNLKAPRQEEGAQYKAKLPAMRRWLIAVAKTQGTVTYGDVMDAFGIGHRNLSRAMDYIGHQAHNLDEPILTALIVSPKTGRCAEGLGKEFDVQDDVAERQALYAFWAEVDDGPESLADIDGDLEIRAARFVSVEARPRQAAFRREVFLACQGRCVVSGCDVVRALDAAHKLGRDWRKGHNGAGDGFVLRKDLHALYDAGLLTISDDGVVTIDASLRTHYGSFQGVAIRSPSAE